MGASGTSRTSCRGGFLSATEGEAERGRRADTGGNPESVNLDEVLVWQWPAGKLRKPASDLERAEINTSETEPFNERRYLGLCPWVKGALDKRGTLYILAIGVDKYPGLGNHCGPSGANSRRR
jgi:hypothetical protein